MKTLNKPLMRAAVSALIQQNAFDHLLDHEQARLRTVFNQWCLSENDPSLTNVLCDYLSKANLMVENMSPAIIQQLIYAMSCNNVKLFHTSSLLEESYDYELV